MTDDTPRPVLPSSDLGAGAGAGIGLGLGAGIGLGLGAGGGGDDAVEVDDGDAVDEIQRAWQRERPGTPVGSIGVITRIWRAGKLLADERRRTLGRLGIDDATLDLLSTLRRVGQPYRLTAGEIAVRTLVSAGAISQRVARAERDGLVTREQSAGDGRLTYVTLTGDGHALIERSVDQLLRHEESLLAALTQVQRAELSALLRILLTSLAPRAGRGATRPAVSVVPPPPSGPAGSPRSRHTA
jgi:DNA-binding MarR family transcriptional regulator